MVDSDTGQVLGIIDAGPVGGTPLIPPSYLTAYFIIFFLFLIALFVYFTPASRYDLIVKFWKKVLRIFFRRVKTLSLETGDEELQSTPLVLRQRVKLLVFLTIIINFVAVMGVIILSFYWLVPTPGVRRTSPLEGEKEFSSTNKIEIVFDRPIDRNELQKSIYPEVPGQWVFENSLYTTHLYRNLVFYPYYSLRPDTLYTIKLSNVRNLVKVSKPYDYELKFKTQASPKVPAVAPFNEDKDVDVESDINVVLDNPNNHISEFSFKFEPEIKFSVSLDKNKRVYNLNPDLPLKQGTKYNLRIQKSDVILNLQDGSVSERGEITPVYEKIFSTREGPGISSFQPSDSKAPVDSEIIVVFSKKMDKKSVEENFSIEPETAGITGWENDATFKFRPIRLSFDTDYKVTVKKGTLADDGGFFEEDLVKTFRTIGNVKVSNITPENGWKGVNIKSPVKVTFDQEVDHGSAEKSFTTDPEIKGSFGWENNVMTFSPDNPFSATTTYKVTLKSGIKSIKGLDSKEEFKSEFTTQDAATKLQMPAYYQKYSLSCEFAALRMALAEKGVNVSEDELISKVGFDKTPHNGNIWGDPYNAFVGNISGRQMADGYGVYWGPIAKAARNYREAQEFEGWSIEMLTKEIINGNPVVIWVYSKSGYKTSWNTPDGKYIYAVRDEHAVTVAGFVGSPSNPTQVIINDPLAGQVYWSRSKFDSKWNIFGRSGVVVR